MWLKKEYKKEYIFDQLNLTDVLNTRSPEDQQHET